MTLAESRKMIKQTLSGLYDDNEIRNFTDLLFFQLLNYSKIDIRLKGNEVISQKVEKTLEGMLKRLVAFEPVQYILGETIFFDLSFMITPHVLIPRPETEEIVDWVCRDINGKKADILDIGTGSGCIAVALAKHLPMANISGCDNDEKALEISVKNAERNGVKVKFFYLDVLNSAPIHDTKYHVLVSNPPYVRESEKALMGSNVLNYEPPGALFVPDEDPLIFYKAIAELGYRILLPEGIIYCEINENLAEETLHVFVERNYQTAEIRRDINGKSRMIKVFRN
jgi:release factor glutamine methyltransferase